MATIRIPTPLRKYTSGQDEVRGEGPTVRALIDGLETAHPGIRERICDESGAVRRFVNVQIANRGRNMQLNEVVAEGLAQAYQSGSDVYGREQALDLQNRGLNNDIFAGNRQGMLDQDRNRMAAAEQLRAQGLANDELSLAAANRHHRINCF